MKKTGILLLLVLMAGCGGGNSKGVIINMDVHFDPGKMDAFQASDSAGDSNGDVDVSDVKGRDVIMDKDTNVADNTETTISDIVQKEDVQGEDVQVGDGLPGEDVSDVVDASDVPGKNDIIDVSDVPPLPDSNETSDVPYQQDVHETTTAEIITADAIQPVDTHVQDTVIRPDQQGCPGADWCSCDKDEDCSSGLCTETAWGKVCAAACTSQDDCKGNLNCVDVDGQKYCVDRMPRRCMPCQADTDCARGDRVQGMPKAQCKALDDPDNGAFCLYECASNDDCGSGYSCDNGHCTPNSGQCDCSPLATALAARTDCVAFHEPQCKGVRQCQGSGLGQCTVPNPPPEVCDGKDNNCDGQADELWPKKGEACSKGLGECKAWGVWVCKADGTGLECNAKPRPSKPEMCDGKDDDCNGKTDDGLQAQPCEKSNQFGTCKGQETCKGGMWVCGAPEPAAEQCDGKDNNCNGKTDEAWPQLGTNCTAGQGACQATGKWVCSSDHMGVVCSAQPGNSTPEVCDGKDDNCNGQTDEGENLQGCKDYCRDQDHDTFASHDDCKCLCAPDDNTGYNIPKTDPGDCDDTDPRVYPGSKDSICGKDADCDGNFMDKGEACDDGNDTDWDGCNSCQIVEFKVDDQATNHAVGDPAVAASRTTGYVVAWPYGDANGSQIRFKRFDTQGHQQGNEVVAATANTGYYVGGTDACWVGDGRFALVWMEFKFENGQLTEAIPYIRVFKADGTPVMSKKALVSTEHDIVQFLPRLACRDHKILVVWTRKVEYYHMSNNHVMYRFFDENGQGTGNAVDLTGRWNNCYYPDTAYIDKGNYIMAYRCKGMNWQSVYAMVIDENNQKLAGTTIVSTSSLQDRVAVSGLDNNQFGIGWVDNGVFKGQTFKYGNSRIQPLIQNPVSISLNDCLHVQNPKAGTFLDGKHFMMAWTWQCQKDNTAHVRLRTSDNKLKLGNEINPSVYNQFEEFPAVAGIKNQFMEVWASFGKVDPNTQHMYPTAVAAQRFDAKGQRLYH